MFGIDFYWFSDIYLMMQEYHDLFKVVDGLHKWVENTFSNVNPLTEATAIPVANVGTAHTRAE